MRKNTSSLCEGKRIFFALSGKIHILCSWGKIYRFFSVLPPSMHMYVTSSPARTEPQPPRLAVSSVHPASPTVQRSAVFSRKLVGWCIARGFLRTGSAPARPRRPAPACLGFTMLILTRRGVPLTGRHLQHAECKQANTSIPPSVPNRTETLELNYFASFCIPKTVVWFTISVGFTLAQNFASLGTISRVSAIE